MRKLEFTPKNLERVANLIYGQPIWFYDEIEAHIIRGEVYNTYSDGMHVDVTIENHCGSICVDFNDIYYIEKN